MSRFARHKDTAHRPTVIALRTAGASVQALDVKDGPDLLVGYTGMTHLMEVKTVAVRTEKDGYSRTRTGKASTGQSTWHNEWRGYPVAIIHGPEEALQTLGVNAAEIGRLWGLTSGWTKDIQPRAVRAPRPFRSGTARARSLAECCKAEGCATSAVPGTKRCAAHAAEETFAPGPAEGSEAYARGER